MPTRGERSRSHPPRSGSRIAAALLIVTALSAGASRAGEGGAAGLRGWISLRFPGVEWVTTERLAEWMEAAPEARPVLLDARTQREFDVSRLRGARRVDPDGDVSELGDLPRDATVVVYCSVGYRSAALARRLSAAGFEHVYNLGGGIFQWANEGRPVYRDGERVQKVHPYDGLWGRLLDATLRSES
jgi:rhodanese-related sulfurtransferase